MALFAVLTIGCHSSQYVVYAPGENLQALTKVTDGENKCDYPFGGDNGKDLFFAVHDKNNMISNIYRKENPFTASMNQKTSGKNQNLSPTFCAATDKLAFSGLLEGSIMRDIYMIDVSQGHALTQITNTPYAAENHPFISRDGRILVYDRVANTGRAGDTEIWTKNLQTNENTMLGLGFMPSFSPDGRTITFVRFTTDGNKSCIWIMDTNGDNQIQVTDANMGFVSHPRFSPDGRYIVFQCSKRDKKDFDLYVIDRNGNDLTQLTINKSYDGEPYWSNDGYIYFTSDRGGRDRHYQIWRFKYGIMASTTVRTSASKVEVVTPSGYHTVRQGETITQIAQKYGVTTRDIVKWNALQTMTLTPGMRLKISAQ